MREAYRKNKPDFYQKLSLQNIQYGILFVYISNEVEEQVTIDNAMAALLDKITAQTETN